MQPTANHDHNHADDRYDDDHERLDYGLDECPLDDILADHDHPYDAADLRPCPTCDAPMSECSCTDSDSPYGHLNARHCW